MTDGSPKSRFGARFQGMLYAFLHATAHRSFLGATIRGWLVNPPVLLAIFLFLMGYPVAWPALILVLDIVLRLLYWKARRDGYVYFHAEKAMQPDTGTPAVDKNSKVPIKATGIFSTEGWEEHVLAKPADYWQVPLGDHAIMVRYSPGRYLYQFVQLDAIETLEAGVICCGAQPENALAIAFQTSWIPETQIVDFHFYEPSDENNPARKLRKIYLAFEDKQSRDSVWQGFLSDGQNKQHEDS